LDRKDILGDIASSDPLSKKKRPIAESTVTTPKMIDLMRSVVVVGKDI
ncbi:MAG: hypothetical protein ACI8S2_001402, partial [Bacteroidia bacterium]